MSFKLLMLMQLKWKESITAELHKVQNYTFVGVSVCTFVERKVVFFFFFIMPLKGFTIIHKHSQHNFIGFEKNAFIFLFLFTVEYNQSGICLKSHSSKGVLS